MNPEAPGRTALERPLSHTTDGLARLLRHVNRSLGPRIGCVGDDGAGEPGPPILRWARSGLMSLTGPGDGAPLLAPRDWMGRLADLCALVRHLARASGGELAIAPERVTERAALAGLSRNADVCPGGTCRILPVRDGHVAVNLARVEDLELLPAWVGCEPGDEPWAALSRAIRGLASAPLVRRAQLLGLPVSRVRVRPVDRLPMRFVRMSAASGGRPPIRPLLVLDFSSLWAGPLCGQLFTQLGARVIKVESTRRPDAARRGPAAFFDGLHQGQEMLALDFQRPGDLARLRHLITQADVVIEASRPRAFAQLGLDPASLFVDNPRLTWISITAYGREGANGQRVGFGDDVAAAAGLVAFDARGGVHFVGDALADPIAGLSAAAGGLAAVLAGGGCLVDTPMVAAASFVAAAPRIDLGDAAVWRDQDTWMVRADGVTQAVLAPRAPGPSPRAAPMGAHTTAVLAALG